MHPGPVRNSPYSVSLAMKEQDVPVLPVQPVQVATAPAALYNRTEITAAHTITTAMGCLDKIYGRYALHLGF